MSKLKLLYIQETDWLEKGPQQQHHLLERMSNRGHKVIVVDYEVLWKEKINDGLFSKLISRSSPPKACDKCNVHIIRPKAFRAPLLNYFSLLISYPIMLSKIIRQFQPDIIMGGGLLTVSIGQLLGKKNNIPYVHSTVDKWHMLIPSKIFRPLGLALESRLAKNADYNIVINEQLKKYEIRIGADPNTTKVIRAGVELDLFKPNKTIRRQMRTKYGYKEDDRVLFFMGWLYTFSGLKEIVEELAKHDDKKMKLCIVGKGDLLDELLRLQEKYQLHDQVLIIDWVNYRELPHYVEIADICLLPAYQNQTMNEIVPIKLYEYLAVKKPVITTYLQGIIREFGKNNGVLYAENSKTVFHTAIKLTKNEIKDLGEKGRKFVEENCNWTKLTDEFENIVKQLVKEE